MPLHATTIRFADPASGEVSRPRPSAVKAARCSRTAPALSSLCQLRWCFRYRDSDRDGTIATAVRRNPCPIGVVPSIGIEARRAVVDLVAAEVSAGMTVMMTSGRTPWCSNAHRVPVRYSPPGPRRGSAARRAYRLSGGPHAGSPRRLDHPGRHLYRFDADSGSRLIDERLHRLDRAELSLRRRAGQRRVRLRLKSRSSIRSGSRSLRSSPRSRTRGRGGRRGACRACTRPRTRPRRSA